MEFFSSREEDNAKIAQEILHTWKNARIFAFYGNLGAGKTYLIKEFCQVLGSENQVSSPTFALVNEYAAPKGSIFHFDFYRIKTEIEAYDIGCDEYFSSGDYCFIEWPERIPSLLPKGLIEIRITVKENHIREIKVNVA